MTREEAKIRMEFCRNFLVNNYSDMGEPNVMAFNMAINALEQEPRWISVSERLPEIHQDVLVSLRSLDVEVGFRAETEPYFYCKGDYIELQNVLAWMPLPEPYKAESEDKE